MHETHATADLAHQLEREAAHLSEEFTGVFDAETVKEQVLLAAEHLPGATVGAFRATLAGRYAKDLLRSMARVRGLSGDTRPQILFVCLRDAGRGQMAAAFARVLSGGRAEVLSAGSAPAGEIHAAVDEAMREAGIELAEAYPKRLHDHFVRASDAVITLGSADACPVLPGKHHEDWDVGDPAAQPLERVREIRDDLRRRVERLLESLGVAVER
jgi:protein-tyrosine-phosphatase